MLRKIMSEPRRQGRMVIQVHPLVEELMKNQGELTRMQQELACTLRLEGVPAMHPEVFSILHENE